jgi:hypothetical protein
MNPGASLIATLFRPCGALPLFAILVLIAGIPRITTAAAEDFAPPPDERQQKVGVLTDAEAGAIALDHNVIDAKTKIADQRPTSSQKIGAGRLSEAAATKPSNSK